MNADPTGLARALIDARRQGKLAAFSAALVPADVAEAMAVQREVAQAVGASVAGWKVGYTPEGIPVAGPLYASLMHRGGARVRVGPSHKSGIEVEIALRLGKDLPPRPGRPYGRSEILDAAAALLIGVEIVEARFPDPPKPPFLTLLADNISNGGYVSGPDVTDFRGLDLSHLRCSLSVDGRIIHDSVGGHAKGDPLAPALDYANQPCDLLGGLKAGQVVTTGTLSGCPFIEGACKVAAEIEGLGKVEFEITE
ncbi:2-keto-4-pentenoate hydratase [Rhizobiales bacterium GAS188]|nr:2-keto-4-pentenoate hydratase [Rhizobiales bacterium GAS188]